MHSDPEVPEASLIHRREVRTGDVAEIRRYLGRLYRADVDLRVLEPKRERPRSPSPAFLHRRTDAGSFALEDVRHGGLAETRANGAPGLIVLWNLDGHVRTTVDEESAGAGPGDIVLGSAGGSKVALTTRDPRLKTTVLDQGLIDRVAADSTVMRAEAVRFTSITPRSAESTAAWIRVRRFVEETIAADDVVATPLVIASVARLLAATALAVFPNTASDLADGSAVGMDGGHHPALVRRAIDYIEQHATDDVGVADIAAAVYVTPRALQYMFRRHLDLTPMAYLRQVRLEHVHRELRAGTRGDSTVTAVAARWGFAHTGRFAVLYRETYGQSPHVTLRE